MESLSALMLNRTPAAFDFTGSDTDAIENLPFFFPLTEDLTFGQALIKIQDLQLNGLFLLTSSDYKDCYKLIAQGEEGLDSCQIYHNKLAKQFELETENQTLASDSIIPFIQSMGFISFTFIRELEDKGFTGFDIINDGLLASSQECEDKFPNILKPTFFFSISKQCHLNLTSLYKKENTWHLLSLELTMLDFDKDFKLRLNDSGILRHFFEIKNGFEYTSTLPIPLETNLRTFNDYLFADAVPFTHFMQLFTRIYSIERSS